MDEHVLLFDYNMHVVIKQATTLGTISFDHEIYY